MSSVLWDTCVVSYWFRARPEWKTAIKKARADFKAGKCRHYISVITIQEMAALLLRPQYKDEWSKFEEFIGAFFENPLDYDTACAMDAAKFEIAHVRPKMRNPKSEEEAKIAAWYHDCAIAGTASRHQFKFIITAETKWRNNYEPVMTALGVATEIYLLTAEPLPQKTEPRAAKVDGAPASESSDGPNSLNPATAVGAETGVAIGGEDAVQGTGAHQEPPSKPNQGAGN